MQLRTFALSVVTIAMLSACGGGGDADPIATPAAPAGGTPPPTITMTLTGVAATGAALDGAVVTATCATGTRTATATASGSYSMAITADVLPCVLTATSRDGHTTLHSVAIGADSSIVVTANITPLTELLLAQLVQQDPAAYLSGATAGQLAAAFTPTSVGNAQTALTATLAAAGVSTANVGNFISGTLVAATSGSAGNAYDQVLDSLAGTLTSAGTTLAALTGTVAATAGAPATANGTGQGEGASLPAGLMLKPKAANCASLASGNYRLIKGAPSVDASASAPVTAVETMTLDAPALTLSNPANPTDAWQWAANGSCQFSTSAGDDIVVSPAGVMVARAFIGADDDTVAVSARDSTRLVVGLPVQSFAVADLAGTWNYLSWVKDSGKFGGEAATFSVDGAGAMTQIQCDADSPETPAAACAVSTTLLPAFTSHADGGFTLTATDPSEPSTERAWLYRSGNGELMMVLLSPDGTLTFATKTRTLSMPAVADVNTSWNVTMNVSGLATDLLSTTQNTVTAVDGVAGSYSRDSRSGSSNFTVPQTIVQNSSRSGYTHRLAASDTASDGSAATVREFWNLQLKGFGLNAYYLPNTSTSPNSNARLGLSVKQP